MVFNLFAKNVEAKPAAESELAAMEKIRTLLPQLSDQEILCLMSVSRAKTFSSEQITCHCPDGDHDTFILLKGTVAVTRQHRDDEHVIDLASEGDLFNVSNIFGAEHDYAAARAVEQADVLAIDSKQLRQLLSNDPMLGYKITQGMASLMIKDMARRLDHLLHA